MNVNTAVRFGLMAGGLLIALAATRRWTKYVQDSFKASAADDEYLPYRAPTT